MNVEARSSDLGFRISFGLWNSGFGIAGSCPHAFFKRTGGDREAKVVADELDSVGARRIEVAISALSLDNERGGLRFHDLAVALRVTNVDQRLDIACHVEVARP